MLNGFFWQNKKVRVRKSLLQQRAQEGGITFPCIRKYHQDSILVAMREWWWMENCHVWELEQHGSLTFEGMGANRFNY